MLGRPLVVALATCVCVACGSPAPEGDADAGSGSTSAGPADASNGTSPAPSETDDEIPWLCPPPEQPPTFALGWHYKEDWIDLEPGGPVELTIGGQGAWMIPIGVRGNGFCVPEDPSAYDYVPRLDIQFEAEGIEPPLSFVTDFPVSFEPIDAGGFGYTFIPCCWPTASRSTRWKAARCGPPRASASATARPSPGSTKAS